MAHGLVKRSSLVFRSAGALFWRRRCSNTSADLDEVIRVDREHVLHPYTSMTNPAPTFVVESASGVHLKFESGERVIDGMSSWWCMLHGYRHPVLDAAAKQQIDKMSHVMFGGLTHRPAVELAALLLRIAPKALTKVFFCDSGSVSVEVAIKMALQYWHACGKPKRTRMLTVARGYHGDTFGAMSVCDPVNGMHSMFQNNLANNIFAPAPACAFDATADVAAVAARPLREAMARDKESIAAVILEPVVQGAGGMRFYSPHYLREVRQLCDESGALLIADEIATGFGRTGKLFACDHAEVAPDILCLGKALTGGYMTLGATLTTSRVAKGISGDGGAFMHGPTFMANPLACAVAHASVKHLLQSPWEARLRVVEQQLRAELMPLAELPHVADVRILGAIGVIELHTALDRAQMDAVQRALVRRGAWLRPFGRLLYTMPPFNAPGLGENELKTLTDAIVAVVREELRDSSPSIGAS